MKLIGLLRREKVDVLHTLARLFVRIPAVIGTVHATFEGEGSKERRRILTYRLTDRLADCTTNVSSTILWIRRKIIRIDTIRNITTPRFCYSFLPG